MRLFAIAGACILGLGLAACGSNQDSPGDTPRRVDSPKPTAAVTKLTILAPADASTVRTGNVVVRGTVIPVGAHVLVKGKSATVADGVFTATTAMAMGPNEIDVSATSPDADPVTTTVHVTRGRTEQQLAAAAAANARSKARAAARRAAKSAKPATVPLPSG